MPNREAKERKRQKKLRHEAIKKWKREGKRRKKNGNG